MIDDPFAQSGYRCRLSWGRRGAAEASARGDILVIVDVLSFSSAVATAVQYGACIIPCLNEDDAYRITQQEPGVLKAVRRDEIGTSSFSLSPVSYIGVEPGTTVALPSPNGATCCRLAGSNMQVYAGCLLNAAPVAKCVAACLASTERGVTVLACGERWTESHDEGCLRVAIEDYLGAGAILSMLPLSKSPEAELCASAFAATEKNLESIIWNCGSGLELRKRGYPKDVQHASMLNKYESAPVLRNGRFDVDI